jgi:uncharacterized protein
VSLAVLRWSVADVLRDGVAKTLHQLDQFVPAQPQRHLPVRDQVRDQVRLISVEVRAELGEEGRRLFGFRVPASMREFLTYDPKPDLTAIEVPVLAVIDDKDRQIDPAELAAIARLVPHARTHLVPDLTHMLRRDPGPATLKNYPQQFQQPVDQELITELTGWDSAQLAPTHR